MRKIRDDRGSTWVASIREKEGDDYKGRFFLVMNPDGETGSEEVALVDLRWNSRKTAERTVMTMSNEELQRRLRSALGRTV